MKKGILLLIPIIVLTTYTSRPAKVPAHQDLVAAPVEAQTPVEEAAEDVRIEILPKKVVQGDPVLVKISGLSGTSTIRAFKFHNKPLPTFVDDKGNPGALIGIDLRLPATTYPLTLTLTDGRVIQENVVVNARKAPTAPLGIPDKLGGDTPEAEKELISTLEQEAKIISAIKSSEERLWQGAFHYPLAGPITITDVYGYSRQTGGSTIAHKGTDFRAATGTPVYAIAAGRVAYVGYMRNYGNVIAVDHGTKLLSIYMHLSKVEAVVGQRVDKGQEIALSGDTGYTLGPHLHLTLRIDNISIDPMIFFQLLGK